VTSRNVLVTGGAGYVGAHACKALARSGYVPFVYDNLSTGHESFVRWGPLIKADIRDDATLREAMLSHDISAALHFAACAYVGESVIDPQKYYDNNVTGTLALLRAMLDTDTSTIVFSSSCAIYGEPEQIPITEAAPKQPVNPYGASKLMIERVLSDYSRAYGLQSIALRYFNAAGADPDGEVGELRDPETHLIPRAMMAIQGYLSDFAVFGSDYPTPDGTAIRDYIHVADLGDAHVAALRRLLDGKPGGAYNLGTGRGYSVKEVLETIAAETGESLRTPMGLRREGDPAALIADASSGRRELGWTPHLSDLETIVRTAWAWHRRAHPKRNAAHELSAAERPI
jgi:UDP-glucose-4-epimerase GalE